MSGSGFARVVLPVLGIAYSSLAFAYVGPGLGGGALAAVLGLLAGLVMLLVGVIWYPIKKLIRRFHVKAPSE